jgi:tetratricopeptide (TPR) repeat protein
VLTASRGAWLGLGAALAIWPLLRARRTWRWRLAGALGAVGLFGLTSVGILSTAETVRERTAALVRDGGERSRPILWRAAWELFRSAPVWGTGAGTFNVFFDRHRPERFPEEPQWAHNDYLNTLSDYGAVGLWLWLGGAAGAIGAAVRRTDPAGAERRGALERSWVRQGMGIGLLAFAFQAVVDFHFKLPGLAIAFGAVAALAVRPRERVPTSPVRAGGRGRRIAGVLVALLVPGGAVPLAVAGYRAEAERSRGREQIDRLAQEPVDPAEYRNRLGRAREHLEAAVALAPAHGGAWADLSYALALFSRIEPGRGEHWGRQAEVAAERALARSTASYEPWVRRGVARDLQGRWYEAGADFARAVQCAPNNATAWFYQADHFSRRASGRQLAEGALTICLRLDPWNGPGLALRQRLAISLRAP